VLQDTRSDLLSPLLGSHTSSHPLQASTQKGACTLCPSAVGISAANAGRSCQGKAAAPQHSRAQDSACAPQHTTSPLCAAAVHAVSNAPLKA
jgi:hypothetical protein